MKITKQDLTKVFGQNISRIILPINVIWFNLFILNYISYIVIANINMFKMLLLYRVKPSEKWAKIIIIDMRGWNIKTNLIEKVSHLDKLTAIIRKSYVFSLSWIQGYYFLLAAYPGYYSTSHKSKVTSHRFT